MLNLLLALVLGGGAIWLLAYLVRLVAAAAGMPTLSFLEGVGFRRCVQRANQADALLERGEVEAGLTLIRHAFYLAVVRDLKLAGTISNHHSGLLSRVLSLVAENQGGTVRLLSLAKVDRLLGERRELQRSYIAARQSSGKAQRARDLTQLLEANRLELEPALQQLVQEAGAASRAPLTH